MTIRDPRELDGAWRRHQRHAFTAPEPDLAPHVARIWAAEWSYATPYVQKMVPYPNVQLSMRPGREPEVSGVCLRHVQQELTGTDRVLGAAFRPGAFRAFLRAPVSSITDRRLPASAVPGLAPVPPGLTADPPALQAWLLDRLPAPDPAGAEAVALVDAVVADPGLTRVDALAARAGASVRQLQRLFAEHVGATPKWVLRRYRLHEVTQRMEAGRTVDWAGLAADLGYADQSHLSRDFTALFGESPTAYARRY